MSSEICKKRLGLIEFRKKHSLTQKQMAKELGVSRQSIWRWETGRTSVPIIMPVTLRGLAMILADRKRSRTRKQRLRIIEMQSKEFDRNEAMKKMPKHIRDALNVRDEK